MQVHSFLEKNSETFTHILADEQNHVCAVFDPVLNYEYRSGRTDTKSTDELISFIKQKGWQVKYIIETHAHADHLSSAPYLKQQLGGEIVIGIHITKVQKVFKEVYNLDVSFKTDASQFDVLTEEGTELNLGDIRITSMHVPGHTPADMAYLAINNANSQDSQVIFVGDTIFAPDVGSARCDFPKGDANTLYESVQRLLEMPEDSILYLCHDYPPQDENGKRRDYMASTTVGEQKRNNKHLKDGTSKEAFVTMRETRDKTLSMPRLILPSVQVNICAGKLPEAEENGVRYLKIPLNAL